MASQKKIIDSLQQEQIIFENQQNATKIFKNFYKNELDNMITQKNKQKLLERERQIEQKKKFNQRCQQGKQLEKLKDISYKNYYQMIMSSQQNNLENYVSPFSKRDQMKMQHINYSVEQQKKRIQQQQLQRQRRISSMKSSYKKELLDQIQQKKYIQSVRKSEREKQKQTYQKISKLPQDIQNWERERKKEEMSKYRQDLDKVKSDKQTRKSPELNGNFYSSDSNHNPLSNPLPYNIQNPYILKQMQKNYLIKNNSYLANIGNNNLS